MNKVSNLSRLGRYVLSFTGATVDEAIKAAENWSEQTGKPLTGNYFLQVKIGRSESIIVDLQPISNEELM